MKMMMEILLTVTFMSSAQVHGHTVEDVLCLAQNVYHEARGESVTGQRAVAHVTLNRVVDPRWPDTICDVVYQSRQFSWTRRNPSVTEPAAFENALMVAVNALHGVSDDPTDGASHFFAHRSVTPRWSRSFETVAVIGEHTFQR
jgi:N-acetylmuramoyl-L-alanine amidase